MALIKNTSRSLQRQVDLATAVCQERLLTEHVRHVLGLVHLVADRLPFDDALDIYVRILRLTPEQARNIGSRALAELGRRGAAPVGSSPVQELEEPEPDDAPEEPGRSGALFARLRRRVRGRVQEDLRERINLSAARTEDNLLETHVENSLVFARTLADELSAPEAIEHYVDTMMLEEGLGDVVYNRALRRIADDVLPPLPRIAADASPEAMELASQHSGPAK